MSQASEMHKVGCNHYIPEFFTVPHELHLSTMHKTRPWEFPENEWIRFNKQINNCIEIKE